MIFLEIGTPKGNTAQYNRLFYGALWRNPINFANDQDTFDPMIQWRNDGLSPRSQYVLSDAQLNDLLLHTVSIRDRILLELMAFCGLRLMEAASLEIPRIDFTKKIIQVVGKGQKIRNVPAPAFLLDKIRKFIGRRVQGYVFPSTHGNAHLTDRAVQHIVRVAGDRIEFKQACPGLTHLNPHTLRHTAARRMKAAGFDYEEIARMLGHNSIAKVAMMYGTKTFEEVQRKADDSLFNLRLG
jgi:integrase